APPRAVVEVDGRVVALHRPQRSDRLNLLARQAQLLLQALDLSGGLMKGQLARGVVNERTAPRIVEVRELLANADQRQVVVPGASRELVDPASGRLVFEQLPDLLEREVVPGCASP